MDIGSNSSLPQGRSHVISDLICSRRKTSENMERKYLQSSEGKVIKLKTHTLKSLLKDRTGRHYLLCKDSGNMSPS